MALIFGNDRNIRGCFHVFLLGGGSSRGAVLKLPGGGQMPTPNFSDPILVTGFSYSQQEAVSFVKCFDDYVYTYAFGHDPNPSVLNVQFMGFLIDGARYSGLVEDFNSKYRDNRVYEIPQYGRLAFGNAEPLKGFLIGMKSNTADPEHSIQQYTATLALVEVQ